MSELGADRDHVMGELRLRRDEQRRHEPAAPLYVPPIAGDYQTPEQLLATKAESDRIMADLDKRLAARKL